MARTVICRIMPKTTNGASSIFILQIHPHSGGDTRQLIISKSQDLKLEYGDRIECVSGTAAVLINPGSPAGMFVLCPRVPPGSDWKIRTELEINDETTKAIYRGEIKFAKDIGTVLSGGTSTTR